MKKIISLLCFFILLNIPITASANPREFNIPTVNVEATINTDGSIDVVEKIQYDFKGKYNGITRNFKAIYDSQFFLNSVKIIDKNSNVTQAKEENSTSENTYQIEKSNNTQIKLYTKSSNESKTIEIQYNLKNVITKSDTIGNINWNFYTVENIPKVNNANLKIRFNGKDLNEGNSSYHIFGDGNLTTNYENGDININIKDLTSILAVDLNIPSEYLTNLQQTPPVENNGGAIENIYPNETKDISGGATFLVILVTGILVVLGIVMVKEYNKREEEIKKYRDGESFICDEFYHSKPEDLPPALINLIVTERAVSVSMLSLSLFYLAHKGYYKIEEIKIKKKKDLKFTRDIEMEAPKEDHLKFLIEMFSGFEELGSFTIMGVEKALNKATVDNKFRENQKEWSQRLDNEASNLGITIEIKNKTILTNYYENERKKWLKYKKHLVEVINSEISEEVLEESTILLIHAKALGIVDSKLDAFNKRLIELNNGKYNNNFDNLYCNNYFIYYFLFTQLYSDVNTTTDNSTGGTFDGGGFSGFSGGGDFGGGGGGGSGAF